MSSKLSTIINSKSSLKKKITTGGKINSCGLNMPINSEENHIITFINDKYIQGGYHVVRTIEERDTIICCYRKQGMRVVVVGLDFSYREFRLLSNSCEENQWEEIIIGGGGGGSDLTAEQIKALYESNINTNAFTDVEKTKLSGLENYNDSAIVSALGNKADKSTTYTKTEVDGLVSSTFKVKGSVANFASLPSSGNNEGDVWNLIDTGANYVWVLNLNNTGNAGWDNLSGVVDLSAYATITAMNIALANKVDKDGAKVLSENDFTTTLKDKLDGISANANNYTLPIASGTVLGGVKEVFLTQTAYNALSPKLTDVKYHIEKV